MAANTSPQRSPAGTSALQRHQRRPYHAGRRRQRLQRRRSLWPTPERPRVALTRLPTAGLLLGKQSPSPPGQSEPSPLPPVTSARPPAPPAKRRRQLPASPPPTAPSTSPMPPTPFNGAVKPDHQRPPGPIAAPDNNKAPQASAIPPSPPATWNRRRQTPATSARPPTPHWAVKWRRPASPLATAPINLTSAAQCFNGTVTLTTQRCRQTPPWPTTRPLSLGKRRRQQTAPLGRQRPPATSPRPANKRPSTLTAPPSFNATGGAINLSASAANALQWRRPPWPTPVPTIDCQT